MDPHDRRALKAAARNSLAAAPYDPKKIILIHTGITVAVSLIGTLINFILGQQIQNTGGLSGLGVRSMLSTAQSVLQVLVAVVLPFWEAGYCFATMNMARDKEAAPSNLLEGFRRFGPLLRAFMLQLVIYMVISITCFLISSQIFMMTPLSNPLFEIVESISMDAAMIESELLLDEATALAMMDAYTPMLLIFLVVFLVVALIVSYRFRMVNFLLLDHPGMKAMEALRMSGYQLRGHKAALFKLDLSFLWFYVLQTVASLLAYGDYLLALFEVPLPVSAEAAFFGFLILSLICQGGLYVWVRNRIGVTYAKFYCLTALPAPKESASDTNNNPWQNQ